MKRFFITGTDTDCGKTFVTCKLLNYFPNSVAIKPIASGCLEQGGQLVSLDALLLQAHTDLSLEQINPWRFKSPVAPHLAAIEQGVHISAKQISDYSLGLRSDNAILFIEGAGGLEVPLNEDETWLDFLELSKIPVVLVVGMQLGCINHALLTARSLAVNKVPCVGWIANCLDPSMLLLQENIATLRNRLDLPCLAIIHHGGEMENINLSLINEFESHGSKLTKITDFV